MSEYHIDIDHSRCQHCLACQSVKKDLHDACEKGFSRPDNMFSKLLVDRLLAVCEHDAIIVIGGL